MESLSLLELALISIPIFAGLLSAMSAAYVLYQDSRTIKSEPDLDPSE